VNVPVETLSFWKDAVGRRGDGPAVDHPLRRAEADFFAEGLNEGLSRFGRSHVIGVDPDDVPVNPRWAPFLQALTHAVDRDPAIQAWLRERANLDGAAALP
jgi:hypothetical protein